MKVSTIVNRFIKKNKNTLFLITLVLILFVIVFYLYKNVRESFNNQTNTVENTGILQAKTVEHKRFDPFTIFIGEEGEEELTNQELPLIRIKELNNSDEHPFHLYDTYYVKKDNIIKVELNTTIDYVINNVLGDSDNSTKDTKDTKDTMIKNNKFNIIDVGFFSFISGEKDIKIDEIVYTLNKTTNEYEFYGEDKYYNKVDLNSVEINENSLRTNLINDENIITKIKDLISISLTKNSKQIVSKFIDNGIIYYKNNTNNIKELLDTLKPEQTTENTVTTQENDQIIRISIDDFNDNIQTIINTIKENEKEDINPLGLIKSIHKSLNDNANNANTKSEYSTELGLFMSSRTYNDIGDLILNFIKERVFPKEMSLNSNISDIKSDLFNEDFKKLLIESYGDNKIRAFFETIESGENNATTTSGGNNVTTKDDGIIPTDKNDIPIYIPIYIHIINTLLDYLIDKFNNNQRYPLGIFTLLPFLLYKKTDNGIIPVLESIFAIFILKSENILDDVMGLAELLSLPGYDTTTNVLDAIELSEDYKSRIYEQNIDDIREFFNIRKKMSESNEIIPLMKIMENCFNILVNHNEEHTEENQNHDHSHTQNKR